MCMLSIEPENASLWNIFNTKQPCIIWISAYAPAHVNVQCAIGQSALCPAAQQPSADFLYCE